MVNPVIVEKDGIKIKPENMKKEKLYHCVFGDKVILVYKDDQDILNCYEIEDREIVDKVKNSIDDDNIEKILEEHIKQQNLKH